MQGWRLEMEDAHISADIPSKPDHLLLVLSCDISSHFSAYNIHIYRQSLTVMQVQVLRNLQPNI